MPQIERDGVTLRVIAGTAFRAKAPTRMFSPTLYVAAQFASASAITLDTEHEERGIYLVSGDLSIEGEPLPEQQMAVLAPGADVRLASAHGAVAMLLGGAPLDSARFIEWNFVSSAREKIEAAKTAWSEQRMGQPGETEFIPLPPQRRETLAPEA